MSEAHHGDREPCELTEAEWEVIRCVWDHEPCTAGTVQEALEETKGWAYSTVKTTMDRMERKGLLRSERLRNLQLFRACIDRQDAQKGEFRKMLSRAFNGALGPMMQFLFESKELGKQDIDQLRKLIRDDEE
jgi:BlaI family penicillinase repressor